MPSVADQLTGGNSQLNAALIAGLETIDRNDTTIFTKYVKVVLPLDGYIFWVKADLLSRSALVNASKVNTATPSKAQTIITPAPTITALGSMHYATRREQTSEEFIDRNSVVFTCENDVDDFNQIGENVIYIATYDGIRFAFSNRDPLYKNANIYHYGGVAILPTMESQIVDDIRRLDYSNIVVSNSLPLWLGLTKYMPVYPAFLSPLNLNPPYATVEIINTEALQAYPYIDIESNHWQLVKDTVKIVMYGLRNFNAMDFIDYVFDYSLNDSMGVMNMPIIKDEKKNQVELGIIAQKKSVEFQISYYQSRILDIAKQLITSTIVAPGNFFVMGGAVPKNKPPVYGALVPPNFFGMNVGLGSSIGHGVPYPALPGMGLVRSWDTGISWAQTHTASNTFDWSKTDAWVAAYGATCDLIYTVWGTPLWAAGSSPVQSPDYPGNYINAPANMVNLGNFITAFMTRYAGQIKKQLFFEVWNEVNLSHWYSDTQSNLAIMAKTIKQAAPGAKVISPSQNGWPYDNNAYSYFTGMMTASDGGTGTMKNWIDAVGQHFYAPTEQQRSLAIQSCKNAMQSVSVYNYPLMDTENGIHDVNKLPASQQIALVLRTYIVGLINGLASVCYYQLGSPINSDSMGIASNPTVMNSIALVLQQIEQYGYENASINPDGSVSIYINGNFYQF